MDEGSQLVAELVAPPPGGRVVDACAGAGGKTLAIGAVDGGQGPAAGARHRRPQARGAAASRAARRPVERHGAARHRRGACCRTRRASAGGIACSSTRPARASGRLRRNPEARWRLTPQAVAGFPARQLALLVTYAPLCAVGRAADLRHLHRRRRREREGRRALRRRARRLRARPGQGDLGARAGRAGGRRPDAAPAAPEHTTPTASTRPSCAGPASSGDNSVLSALAA